MTDAPIYLTDTGSEYLLTGQTFLKRHAIAARGATWDAERKGWTLPLTPENCNWAIVDLGAQWQFIAAQASQEDAKGETVKRGRGRPKGSRNRATLERDAATGESAAMVADEDDADAEAKLADALAAFVAQHAPKAAKAAPMDPEAVKAIVRDETIGLAANIADIRAKLESRKADVLEIRQGESVRVVEGLQHRELKRLIQCLSTGLHVWVAGPSGSGKTHGAEQAAKALGLSFALQGAMTMAHELTGFVDAGGRYHETPFVRAFRNGGLILLDELDAGSNEALLALNGALANGIMCLPSGDNIRMHADFRCVGAANTFGAGATHEYVGRTRIDAAFLQRFGARIMWDYDADLEIAMSGNPDWAKRVQRAREKARQTGLKALITPRASQAGAKLIAAGATPDEAAALTYLADLTPAQRQAIGG